MAIRMDLARAVRVDTTREPWVVSPAHGVERRMLERAGGESGRATSIVRYAPGATFAPHVHDGGEEFFVLDGEFRDEHGIYPRGSYVRNPPGSRHAPSAPHGCVLFVRLCQMPRDAEHVVDRDALARAGPPGSAAVVELHNGADARVTLVRHAPGFVGPCAPNLRGVDVYVVDGGCVVAGAGVDVDGACAAGTWLRAPPRTSLAVASPGGCVLLVREGVWPAP